MSIRFESNVEPVPGYRLLERIGSGGFGEVWKCEAPGGIFKAVKIIHGDLRSKDSDLIRYAEQELKALKRVKMVRHPYLLALDRYDIVDGRLLIVMELADCNLWEKYREHRLKGLTGIPREQLMLYMSETAEVLDLMNFEHQLLHLDIKPQNIFLQYTHVNVGDFGQVKDLEGLVASVTGGITPVYAAPETFDGVVTRYCDQYSLACVYQELLTGQRPFDGTSMQQLLMQHLTMPPNLAPSPAADRGALSKALAKKPEDRFANCREFVAALTSGAPVAIAAPVRSAAAAVAHLIGDHQPPRVEVGVNDSNGSSIQFGIVQPPKNTSLYSAPIAAHEFVATPLPDDGKSALPTRNAPLLKTGPGPVRPTIVIGLGATGLKILQRLRTLNTDRFGSAASIPALRTLYIDTDPESLALATKDRTWDGISALRDDELFPARLTRAAHYMKPRATGRPLTDGWLDHQILNKLPRQSNTLGMRAFGRLALVDHFRALSQKIESELDICCTPEALQETLDKTGLKLATNRPRIYVISSLAGGTGSGMFIDLGYILQQKLRKLGYIDPDVVGVFIVPPENPLAEYGPQARANVYAALTELNHFSRPDTTYQAYFDDRHAVIRDSGPPYRGMYIVPVAPATDAFPTPVAIGTPIRTARRSSLIRTNEGIRSNAALSSGITQSGTQRNRDRAETQTDELFQVAEWLRLDLFGPLSPMADAARFSLPPGGTGITVRTFGLVAFDWPRSMIVSRTASVVAGVVLDHWISLDAGRARETIPAWAADLWNRLNMTVDSFLDRLREAASKVMNGPAEDILSQISEAAMPRGWLSRQPDPSMVITALAQFDEWLGHPVPASTRAPTPIEEATRIAAAELASVAQAELSVILPHLIDDPQFRLAGAEEAARQLSADMTRISAALNSQADRLDEESRTAYECLASFAHQNKTQRVPANVNPAEALKAYPRMRFQAIIARRAARTYAAFKDVLGSTRTEIAACRNRLQAFHATALTALELPTADIGPMQVMPPGCGTIEEAAKRYLAVLTDDDLAQIETWVQAGVEETSGGLYQACLNTADGADSLIKTLRERTRAYLNMRLGEVDLAAMFESRYGPPSAIADVFRNAYYEATPKLVGQGPWSRQTVTIFGAPAGFGGDPLRHAAHLAFPHDVATHDAETSDEAIIYREFCHVPLNTLPHFGPVWTASYDGMPEMTQCSPHSRTDISRWLGADVE